MEQKNYYEILGVHRNATREEIQDAFHQLALRYHPDINPDDPRAEECFKEISAAYDVLEDADERAQYDQKLQAAWRSSSGQRRSATWEYSAQYDRQTRSNRYQQRQSRDQSNSSTWQQWTSGLDTQELVDFVVDQLGKHIKHRDIIFRICRRTRMPWHQAEAFVQWVEINHQQAIFKRQSPILFALSLVTLIGGIVIVGLYAWVFVGMPVWVSIPAQVPLIELLVIGAGMIGGGLMGIQRTVKSLGTLSIKGKK